MPEFLPEVPVGGSPQLPCAGVLPATQCSGRCIPLREARRLAVRAGTRAGVGTALQKLLPAPAVAATHVASPEVRLCVTRAFPQLGWVYTQLTASGFL